MRRYTGLAVLAGVIVLTGCIQSLHPFYTKDDLTFDPALVGVWSEENSSESWDFTKAGDDVYELVYTDSDGKKGAFDAHLAMVSGHLFLDFYPKDTDLDQNDFYKFHLLPVHSFAYVKQIQPTLQMQFPDSDWLSQFLRNNPDALKHEIVNDDVVLTASPKALQKFWVKHLETEKAYGDASDLTRQSK